MTNWRRWMAIPLSTRWAICIWVLLLLGVFSRVAVARPSAQSVVPVYTLAGERWWNGEPLYAPPPIWMDVYRNPPGFAAIFAPLSQLPPKLVGFGWRLLGIGLFALGLRRFLSAVNPTGPSVGANATVWILAAILILPAFNNGQVNLPMTAAMLLGTAAAVRGNWWKASGWLMFAVSLKGYPIALAGLLMLLAPARLSWRMPIVLLAFLAAPYALQNYHYVWHETVEFWHITESDDRSHASMERTVKGWTYLIRVTTGDCVGRETTQVVAAIAGLCLAGVVLRAVRRNGANPELYGRIFCAGLVWMVLFGPATEGNTYSLLAPVGWLVVGSNLGHRNKLIGTVGVGLLLVVMLRGLFPMDPDTSLASLQPLGAVLLLSAVVEDLITRRQE